MEHQANYQYRGARAMVILHERYLREFYETWKQARAARVTLPEANPNGESDWNGLLAHVLGCARGYMVWMCRMLKQPDPEIQAAPDIHLIDQRADAYIEHVLARWRMQLHDVPEESFYVPEYETSWHSHYCIDAMMEHAVMHPIRHTFQLRELISDR